MGKTDLETQRKVIRQLARAREAYSGLIDDDNEELLDEFEVAVLRKYDVEIQRCYYCQEDHLLEDTKIVTDLMVYVCEDCIEERGL